MNKYQWRLSFSRAEIVLLNSWMPVQQIVYHMLRFFLKTERLTDVTDSSGTKLFSNYNIKTLTLWACELKPESWWTDDTDVITICVTLLHNLADWLNKKICPHYFVNNCHLVHNPVQLRLIATELSSTTESWLSMWFVDNYLRKCAQLCPDRVSQLFDDIGTRTRLHVQNAVSAVVEWRQSSALSDLWDVCNEAEYYMSVTVSTMALAVRSSNCWIDELAKIDLYDHDYFTAVAFLHIAIKITDNLLSAEQSDELMDVLATLVSQFVAKRPYRYCHQLSSQLSLSQAVILRTVTGNNSCSTKQQIKFELSKAYLNRALRCQYPTTTATELDISELTTLLQQSAVDHLTTSHQLKAKRFETVATMVTTDFEALYAYKCGRYQRCLQLSTENVLTLLNTNDNTLFSPSISTFPEFIQLMDNDVVSLTAVTLIVNPGCRFDTNYGVFIAQLTLSLYLMTQCQLKLHFSEKSLAQTLDYIKDAQSRWSICSLKRTLDRLILKLTERLIKNLLKKLL